MRNQDKASRLSAAAFLNACRLHRDSVLLFKHGRYPSAFQLSVLAQEEIGKTFLLEEFIFRVRVGEHRAEDSGKLMTDILSHRSKQLWFTLREWDVTLTRSARVARFVEDARSGRLETRKQNATYVGLTRRPNGKPDPKGRIVAPNSRISEKHAAEQLTRVGDVLTWLVDGYQRGILMMDTEELEACLTQALEAELEELWPDRTPALQRILDSWHTGDW